MERLSPQSMLNAIGQSGQTSGSSLMPQLGLTGAVGLTSQEESTARAWLASKTPVQVDEAIRHSLISQLGVSVNVKREWRYPEDRPAYMVAITAGVTALSKDNIPQAMAKLEAALTPPTHETAELMVSQLQQALGRRSSSEEASEVGLDLYVSILRRHPVDVAKAAVLELATEPRPGNATAWFPTAPELEGVCRRYAQDRTAMLDGLKCYREPDPRQIEISRLHGVWRALAIEATALGHKVGPGPAKDEGERGERIAAWDAAVTKAGEAKQAWLTAQRED